MRFASRSAQPARNIEQANNKLISLLILFSFKDFSKLDRIKLYTPFAQNQGKSGDIQLEHLVLTIHHPILVEMYPKENRYNGR